MENMRIYNLFPRYLGRVDRWAAYFAHIQDLGFNWVYLNPFHYSGFSGSLYAVKDYYALHAMFSVDPARDMQILRETIQEAHQNKLKVIMDLVINHTAKDHPFVQEHPEWYLHNTDGSIHSPGARDGDHWVEWGDLAEVDNHHSTEREAIFRYWQELVLHYCAMGFDGFRCDAAYQLPMDLWEGLIRQTKKKYPRVQFFAENLGCSVKQSIALGQAGFDCLFSSSRWWDFSEPWLLAEYEATHQIAPSVSFPESHDTERLWAYVHGNPDAFMQRLLFSAFFSAGWMITMGCEYAFERKPDVVHTTPDDWERTHRDYCETIRRINKLRQKYPLFGVETTNTMVSHSREADVLALRKVSTQREDSALLLLNKNAHAESAFEYGALGSLLGSPSKVLDLHVADAGAKASPVPADNYRVVLMPGEVRVLYASHT